MVGNGGKMMENGEGCCKSKVQWNSFRKFWGLEKYISTTIVSTLNINAWMIWDKILVAVELIRPVLRITQIFRLIGTTSIWKSRSRFASRKCQTQHAVAQNVLSKNCFPRHAELYHTSEEKTSHLPKKGINPSKCSQMALCGCWHGNRFHEIRIR